MGAKRSGSNYLTVLHVERIEFAYEIVKSCVTAYFMQCRSLGDELSERFGNVVVVAALALLRDIHPVVREATVVRI